MNKLTIAKYKDGFITIGQYNKSVHRGKIFCPFCNPPIKVTGVENKFFRAMPDQGGHNCGRGAVIYFNSEWEGSHLIETINSNDGEIEIIIDINTLGEVSKGNTKKNITEEQKQLYFESDNKKYYKYNNYKKVLRDIIRTVSQMKRLIEQNVKSDLDRIKFKYKIGNEKLGINDILVPIYNLNISLHNKKRFIVYIVESVNISNCRIYINSYETDGKIITTSFNYTSTKNQTGISKDDLVIAYGNIKYYKDNKYYLNIVNELNIVKMRKDDEWYEILENKNMVSWKVRKQYNTNISKENNVSKIDISNNSNLLIIAPNINGREQNQQIKSEKFDKIVEEQIIVESIHNDSTVLKEKKIKVKTFINKLIKKFLSIIRK